MHLTIVLRKEVPDVATAQQLSDIVKDRLSDQPEVTMTSSVSTQIEPPNSG